MNTRTLRLPGWTVAAAVIAGAVVVAGFVVNVRELAATFIVAYVSIVSVALGTLAVTLIAHLTTATWFRPFRARADLIIASLPVLAVLGVILLLALPVLYPWMHADNSRAPYLNAPFFVVRAIIYWAAWITIGESVLAARRLHLRGEIERANRRFRRIASAGLIVLGVTMTFAAFDWMMSLTPEWESTIYGIYWFAGGAVGALALLAMLARFGGATFGWPSPSPDDVHSLAKLVLTFVLFWVYIGFAQYIVIWSGDLPSEITWYIPRTHGGWGMLAGVLVFGNFAFPFLLLLLQPVRRSHRALAAIGATLLVLHYVDMFWVIVPGLVPMRWWTGVVGIAVLFLSLVAVGALFSSPRFVARAQTLAPLRVA